MDFLDRLLDSLYLFIIIEAIVAL